MTENNLYRGDTPIGNTGCVDTLGIGLRSLVDWVSVSFPQVKTLHDLCGVLSLDYDLFEVRDVGYRGYKYSALYGHILVAWGASERSKSMGGFIEMSGQGCREYELEFDLKLNWSHFFALVMAFEHKFSRLDLAIDDFKGYFTVEQAYRCAKKGCLVAQRVKTARSFEQFNLDDGKTDGRTLYIGKADWQITFYDKIAERANANVDVLDFVSFWNRYEIRLRNKIATDAAHMIAYESYTAGQFVKGFMSAKIDFKINNKSDSNKSRWKSQKWWLKFLDNADKVVLSQQAPDPTIPRIKKWFDVQIDTSFNLLLEAFDNDSVVIDYITLRGREKRLKKHDKALDEFLKYPEQKKALYQEMSDFVKPRKDAYEREKAQKQFDNMLDKHELFISNLENKQIKKTYQRHHSS